MADKLLSHVLSQVLSGLTRTGQAEDDIDLDMAVERVTRVIADTAAEPTSMQYADAYAAFVGDPAEHEAHLQSLADTLAQRLEALEREQDELLRANASIVDHIKRLRTEARESKQHFKRLKLALDPADADDAERAAVAEDACLKLPYHVPVMQALDEGASLGGSAFRQLLEEQPPSPTSQALAHWMRVHCYSLDEAGQLEAFKRTRLELQLALERLTR